LHVAERLLIQRDGPMLEAIKGLNGGLLRLPRRTQDYPIASVWRCGSTALRRRPEFKYRAGRLSSPTKSQTGLSPKRRFVPSSTQPTMSQI
jgi:hypothetical protein